VGITGSYFLIRKKGKSIAIPKDIQNISVNPNDKKEVATIEEVFNFINTIPSLVKNVFSLYEKDAFTKMETFVVGISCDVFESKFEEE
jgi:hypothetical protein